MSYAKNGLGRGWPDGTNFRSPITPVCALCDKEGKMTKHHLAPSVRGVKRGGGTLRLCHPCHVRVHQAFTNEQLGSMHWPEVRRALTNQSS